MNRFYQYCVELSEEGSRLEFVDTDIPPERYRLLVLVAVKNDPLSLKYVDVHRMTLRGMEVVCDYAFNNDETVGPIISEKLSEMGYEDEVSRVKSRYDYPSCENYFDFIFLS